MPWETIGAFLTSALGVVGMWIQARHRHGGRSHKIKGDLELLALLPKDSKAREALLDHIDSTIIQGIKDSSELRRDPFGIAVAAVLIVVAVIMGYLAVAYGGWWWWPLAGVFGLFGLVGFVESAARRKRDDKGRSIEGPKQE